ncbi:iron complex transport system substrate-binding protein [Alteribacillus persepolensis]|uniref:Iron complex transport system substrate-binding protein n=1 Tax=Alteribacillus persepolensis TaxID=568899 RepID=A0A1G8C7D9_9BACI|nr:iron-siderophore ABC transporter substrate-binding protein [Alteribacillus persepolensis]SDH41292.1 iron complex transport system substrate-binding protein [Alteribacillus persepolensis]
MKKNYILAVSFLLLLLIAAACSQGDSSDQEQEANDEENQAQETETITVTDARGEQQIEGTPETIVVLEWVYAEDLLALGVEPAGVADIEGYNQWVNIEPQLSDSVTDVGTRQEPSLEEIAQLEPDLIITAQYRHEAISEELNEIAPTLMFEPYPPEGEGDQYEEMETTFKEIAKAVNKEEEADQVLNELETAYDDIAAKLEEEGADGTELILSQAFSANETASIRLFTDNSMAVNILNKIGIENAYDGTDFEIYGYSEATVENLEPYQDAEFMYIVQDDDNVFANQLAGNPVWENLNFVEENRTHRLPGDTWTFGGPLSAEVFANQAAEALIGE